MLQLSDQRTKISLNEIKEGGLVPLLCAGIVNPMGPTLTITALRTAARDQEHSFEIVEIMLNPFSQEVHRVGCGGMGDSFNTVRDYALLYETCSLFNCPTLFLPSRAHFDSNAAEIHASWLCRFPDSARKWRMIRKHRVQSRGPESPKRWRSAPLRLARATGGT